MNYFLALGIPGGPELLILLFIFGLPFLMLIIALVDILRSEFKEPNNKIVWLLVAILLPFIGSLLYFLIGRGQKAR